MGAYAFAIDSFIYSFVHSPSKVFEVPRGNREQEDPDFDFEEAVVSETSRSDDLLYPRQGNEASSSPPSLSVF